MVKCFDEKLKHAQCCILKYASNYVSKVSRGEGSEQELNTLILMDGYLNALERYVADPQPCVDKFGYLKNGSSFITFKGKALYLSGKKHKVAVAPNCFNCLTEDQVNKIFEQISTVCGSCSCNC